MPDTVELDGVMQQLSELQSAVTKSNDPDAAVKHIISTPELAADAAKAIADAGQLVQKDDVKKIFADEWAGLAKDGMPNAPSAPEAITEEKAVEIAEFSPESTSAVLGTPYSDFGIQRQMNRADHLHRKMFMPNAYKDQVWSSPGNANHERLQDLNDAIIFEAGMVRGLSSEDSGLYRAHVTGTKLWEEYVGTLNQLGLVKANEITDTTITEWIPTLLSSQFLEIMRLALRIPALFNEISMPSPTYEVPLLLASLVAKKASAAAEVAGQSYTSNTGKMTLTAQKIQVLLDITGEASEDSIIPLLPLLRTETAQAFAEGWEDAILNGDNDTTHMDVDVTGSEDIRKIWDGLRRLVPAGRRTDFSAAISEANLRTLRTSLGKYAVNPNGAVYIMGVAGYLKTLASLSQTRTVDQYGPQATIVTGELAKFDGIPIVVSGFIREVLSADGYNTSGGPNTFTVIHLINPRGFVRGNRRSLSFETDRNIRKDITTLVASQRGDFQRTFPSETTDALGYNVPIT